MPIPCICISNYIFLLLLCSTVFVFALRLLPLIFPLHPRTVLLTVWLYPFLVMYTCLFCIFFISFISPFFSFKYSLKIFVRVTFLTLSSHLIVFYSAFVLILSLFVSFNIIYYCALSKSKHHVYCTLLHFAFFFHLKRLTPYNMTPISI